MNDIALIVDTHSNYSDVWEPCFHRLDRYFNDIKKYAIEQLGVVNTVIKDYSIIEKKLPCNNNTWDYLTEVESILYTQRTMSEYYQGSAYSETTETYIQRVAETVNRMIDNGEYGDEGDGAGER